MSSLEDLRKFRSEKLSRRYFTVSLVEYAMTLKKRVVVYEL